MFTIFIKVEGWNVKFSEDIKQERMKGIAVNGYMKQ